MSYVLDSKLQDCGVTTAKTLNFQLYLHLPQHLLDVSTQTFSIISAPTSTKKSSAARSLGVCFAAASGGSTTPPTTPQQNTIGNTTFGLPAMKLFVSANNDPTKEMRVFLVPSRF